MKKKIFFFLFVFFFIGFIDGIQLQKSANIFTLQESISKRQGDRPWRNMTNGLICESEMKAFVVTWPSSFSQVLKSSNFSFEIPNESQNLIVKSISVSWTVSVNRVPKSGLKEVEVIMYLGNGTELNTNVRNYDGYGWQPTENQIVYPMENETSTWGLNENFNISMLASEGFGFGLVVKNGYSDTTARVTCIVVTIVLEEKPIISTFSKIITTLTSSVKKTIPTTKKQSSTTKNSIITSSEDHGDGGIITIIVVLCITIVCCFICLIMAIYLFMKRYRLGKSLKNQVGQMRDDYDKVGYFLKETTENIYLKDIKLGDKIGQGRTGTVWIATMDNNTTVAAKRFILECEIEIGKMRQKIMSMNHISIVQIYGFYFQDEDTSYLIMEYFSRGSLTEFIYDQEIVKWIQPIHMQNIMMFIASGLSYLKKHEIVHGSLTAKNVLIKIEDDLPVAKITDFGLVNYIKKDFKFELKSEEWTNLLFSAPEILSYRNLSYSSDVYSFGMIAMYLFNYGEFDFSSYQKIDELYSEIASLKFGIKERPINMNEELFILFQQCMDVDSKHRPDIDAANKCIIMNIERSVKQIKTEPSNYDSINELELLIGPEQVGEEEEPEISTNDALLKIYGKVPENGKNPRASFNKLNFLNELKKKQQQ